MIAAMLQRGLGSEPTILRSLENPSDRLTNLLDEFTKWLWIESVPVICYFENKVTNYVAKTGLPFNVPTLVCTNPVHKQLRLTALGCGRTQCMYRRPQEDAIRRRSFQNQ